MLFEECPAFAFWHLFRRPLVMEDVTDAEFVFHEDRRVERDLVPIRNGKAAFDAERTLLGGSAMVVERVFKRDPEPVRQTDLDFLREQVRWLIELERVALVDEAGENSTGRQHIGLGEIREPAPGEIRRGAIRTRHFFT